MFNISPSYFLNDGAELRYNCSGVQTFAIHLLADPIYFVNVFVVSSLPMETYHHSHLHCRYMMEVYLAAVCYQ